jgi:hypothetical protein
MMGRILHKIQRANLHFRLALWHDKEFSIVVMQRSEILTKQSKLNLDRIQITMF